MKDTFWQLNMLAQDFVHTYFSKSKIIVFPSQEELPHTSISFCIFLLTLFIARIQSAGQCTKDTSCQAKGT